MAESDSTNFFTNRLYDRLKFVAVILLPALGTLYFALAQIWGLPKVIEVIGTISALDTFLGFVLHISTNSYYKNGQNFDGTMHVNETDTATQFQLELNSDPADLPGKHSVKFNVNKVTS